MKKVYTYTNQKDIRKAFWAEHPQFKSEYRTRKTQNDYNCDIRQTWCEFVHNLHQNGMISDAMIQKVTL